MARILIVDDEQPILNVLRLLVRSQGHDSVTCDDGRDALKLIDSDEPFDLMLSDLRMNPVNGMDLLRSVSQKRPQLPVILVSAYLSEDNWKEAQSLGAFDCLSKPFRPDALTAKITAALARDKAS